MEKQIEIIRSLQESGVSLVLLLGEEVVYKSEKSGVLPLLDLIENYKLDYSELFLGDKVLGKGGSLLVNKLGIENLYTQVLSESGKGFLREKGIGYSYDYLVPYIMNRDQTGPCPIEGLSDLTDDPDELIRLILNFFEKRKSNG